MQIFNQMFQPRQQNELKAALEKSGSAVQEQTVKLEEQNRKLAEGQALIKRLASDVKNQSLKQEAGLYMLNQTVSDLGAKATPYGAGGNGTGRYGGTAGPLERIADAMAGLANRAREYFDGRELTDIRFDPMNAVREISPAD